MSAKSERQTKLIGVPEENLPQKEKPILKKVREVINTFNTECLGGSGQIEAVEELGCISIVVVWNRDEERQTQQRVEVRVVKNMFLAVYLRDDFTPCEAHNLAFYGCNNAQLSFAGSWRVELQKILEKAVFGTDHRYGTRYRYGE